MKYKFYLLGLIGLGLLSNCTKDESAEQLERERQEREIYLTSHNITVDPTPSGLYYVPVVEGTGESPIEDGYVDFEFTVQLVDGSVFSTSDSATAREYDLYNPNILYGPTRLKMSGIGAAGLWEGLQYMNEGGEAVLVIPSEINGYGNIGTTFSPPYSTHVYEIKLVNAFEHPDSFEMVQIDKFIEEMEIPEDSIQTSPRGVRYYETAAGSGDFIKSFDSVYVWYAGTLLDGRQFDSNIGSERGLFGFQMPALDFIDGWGEAMYFMRQGSQGLIVIPYELAYGENGTRDVDGNIVVPTYSTIVFDVEVVKVVSPGSQ